MRSALCCMTAMMARVRPTPVSMEPSRLSPILQEMICAPVTPVKVSPIWVMPGLAQSHWPQADIAGNVASWLRVPGDKSLI